MTSIPVAARAYLLCVLLCTAVCALPVLDRDPGWGTVGLLVALYALCELPAHRAAGPDSTPVSPGSFFPVLLAAAFLLPPAAAVLVAVPGALLGRVDERPATVRRLWRAARLALATWAAARTYLLFGVGHTPGPPDFPYAMLSAAAGALAFCLVLTALEAGILATAEGLPPRTAWRGLLPGSVVPHLVHGLAGLMMAVLWRSPYGPVSALFVLLPMYISCWLFAQYHRESTAHQATLRALVQAVDLKDRYTRGHSERVGRASVLIARELRMDPERIERIRFAGILHDVGKLGVPTRVLRKEGPLTPEERRVIELHPEYGHEIVRGIGFLGEARAAILHHHERLDGTGYPHGLAGEQIPEFARVVAVADAFDAMTSTRSYRRARPVEAALRELERCAGTQFDPRMVTALVRALEQYGRPTVVTSDDATEPHPPPSPPAAQPSPPRSSLTSSAPLPPGRGIPSQPAQLRATARPGGRNPGRRAPEGPAPGPGTPRGRTPGGSG
ncbi:HD-GYP domain-containing protein [Streptomyces sp. NPDC051018]|uniref:HD-GYP domain-containing protein n=1 Tax=Streptomyces sp. NPDC051018 TaxID=3365639 RepID=UPI003791C20A